MVVGVVIALILIVMGVKMDLVLLAKCPGLPKTVLDTLTIYCIYTVLQYLKIKNMNISHYLLNALLVHREKGKKFSNIQPNIPTYIIEFQKIQTSGVT